MQPVTDLKLMLKTRTSTGKLPDILRVSMKTKTSENTAYPILSIKNRLQFVTLCCKCKLQHMQNTYVFKHS